MIVAGLLILSGTLVFLKGFGSLLNRKSLADFEWKSEKYAVTKHTEHGYAGPPIQVYTLFEFKVGRLLHREIATTVDIDDESCIITFKNYSGSKIINYNKCQRNSR